MTSILTLLTTLILIVAPLATARAVEKNIPKEKTHQGARFEDFRPSVPERYKNLGNPLKRDEKNLLAGERLYDIKCSPCHGGNLDGYGPEASGFFPPPANLITTVSIVRASEAYLFWRIKEGGPGLPQNWRPWDSAMPVWKNELKDEEIWQIILYIYEAVGESPP